MTFIKNKRHYKSLFILLLFLLFIVVILACSLGAADITFLKSMEIIISKIPIINRFVDVSDIKEVYFTIVLNIRLPRTILSALVGLGLSVVGASYQGMFKNPMADPFVLGVSSGAAIGATAAIVIGLEATFLGFGSVTIFAFAGAILTTLIVYNIARVGSKVPVVTLLLSGIAVNFFLSSMISMAMIFNREQIEKIILWTMGSVSAASWTQVLILLPVVAVGTIGISAFSRDLNIILTGDDEAKSIGVEVERVKKMLLIIASIIIAAIVSVSGVIGFVGLIIPHIIRIVLGSDHRVLIPFSALVGAIFMITCDTLARILAPPAEIPVGAITSLFGAPYFIYLLIKSKKKVF
jgi:iron complex transport system permease protein